MNQSLTCLNGERNSSTGRETSRYVSQQAGEPGGVADGGSHFSLVAFCVLGDWSERRKAHRMTGVLSPLPRSLHQQQASAGNTCGPTVEGSSFLKPSEWPQALTHRQATWPAVSTGTLGLAALLSVRLARFLKRVLWL